jgi:dynein heavy chain 1
MVEQGGYWNSDNKWVMLRRIQFVGAANPPTDAGRVVLSNRFLRWAPVLLVDYPVEESMKQIYRVFNQGLLKLHKHLMDLVDPLNNAMVIFYLRNQERFTPDIAPQYIYSPRELSRWTRAMFEAMEPMSKDNEAMSPEELVTLWGHEALRLFHDRCITHEERDWVQKLVDSVAETFFGPKGIDTVKCLQRPLLYSKWITGKYIQTGRADLKVFVSERLKRFYDEELDVKLVIFDDVLDHVLRIDNVL